MLDPSPATGFRRRCGPFNAFGPMPSALRDRGSHPMNEPKTDLVERFWRSSKARHLWPDEVRRRAQGLTLEFTDDFFFHMNPLYEPSLAMQYVVGRYEAAYDAIAALRPRSILEIGCAHGLSTWLMTSWAERVVGLDISPVRVAVGRHLFPEVEWIAGDWREYLATGETFDLILSSHGPIVSAPEVDAACTHYINIGYRTKSWGTMLRGRHKLRGTQLSFSTTITGANPPRRTRSYLRYFFRRNWLKEARHALVHGNALPL